MIKLFSDLITAFGYSKELNPHEVDCEQIGTYPLDYVNSMVENCLKYCPDTFNLTKMIFNSKISDREKKEGRVYVDIEMSDIYIAGSESSASGTVEFNVDGTPLYIYIVIASHNSSSIISMSMGSINEMESLLNDGRIIVPVAIGHGNSDGESYVIEKFDTRYGLNRYHLTPKKELYGIMTSDDKGLIYDN